MIKSKKLAILFMGLWASFFVSAMSANKILDKTIPTEMIVFYRLFFALLWFTPYLLKNKKTVFKTNIFKLHFIRSIFTGLTIFCTYYSYRHLPLAVATSIGLSGPLFTTLLAALFLKEKITFRKAIILMSGYIGVLLVVTKNFLKSINELITFLTTNTFFLQSFSSPTLLPFEKAVLIALLGNFLMAIVLILLKKVTNEDSPQTTLFYNTFLTMMFFAIFGHTSFCMPDPLNLSLLIIIGAFGIALQYCYTKAMSLEEASFIAPLEYLRIVIALPVGIIFFNESLMLQQIIGILLILLTTYRLSK
ncbi:MAG: EamA family transporter [Proteobacteria bacterium]|nr:EamA family transporter [Pseudomonadota bacterium]